MVKPKGLYRLAGLSVNQELSDIIKDICLFARNVSGREFNPQELGWMRWYIKRWPAVKRYLNRIDFTKKESELDLGTIRSEFG
jgi:hypothetical protein